MLRRFPRRLLCTALGLLVLGSAAAAGPWARFHGPNGTGATSDKDVPVAVDLMQHLRWKAPIPGNGNASPVVWGDRVFVHTASDDGGERMLLCLDATTGKTLWTQTMPGVKVKIRFDSSLASATPATDGAGVYVPFWDGKDIHMAAFGMDGTPRWRKNLGPFVSQHGAGASPILYGDKVIYALDMDKEDANKQPTSRPAVLYALDKRTGDIAWEAPREAHRACYSPPFLRDVPGGPPELIVVSTTAATSYNPNDGTKNWELRDWQGKSVRTPLRTIASPALVGNTLVASSGDGGGDRYAAGLAVPAPGKTGGPAPVWENKKDFPYVPCPVTRGEHLYFVNDAGFAGCYEVTTGKRVWQERLPNAKPTYASPVLVDDKVYVGTEQGDLHVFAAEPTFKLLATSPLGERIRATPAVADGRLYVRGQTHLFCIGKSDAK